MAKKLYKFNASFGRMGDLDSLFIADESAILGWEGNGMYFGEVLGKHSEIYIDYFVAKEYLTMVTENKEVIRVLEEVFPEGYISGIDLFEAYEMWSEMFDDSVDIYDD